MPWRGSEGLDALTGDRVKQFRLPGVGGGAGEQDQPGSLAGRVIVDLQGLPDPDDPGGCVASFTEFVAVHSQHGRQQVPIAKAPYDTQGPAGPPGGGSQPFLGQQMPKLDPEGHAGLGQQPHRLSFGMPGGDAGSQPGDQRPQLADRIGSPPGVAGDVGQPDHRAAERERRPHSIMEI